jgi:hypothetical protein
MGGEEDKTMFASTAGGGFSIQFSNGWKVSAQFHEGAYCSRDQRSVDESYGLYRMAQTRSPNAEIAVIGETNGFLRISDEDVAGYVSADTVAKVIATVATFPEESEVSELRAERLGALLRSIVELDFPDGRSEDS